MKDTLSAYLGVYTPTYPTEGVIIPGDTQVWVMNNPTEHGWDNLINLWINQFGPGTPYNCRTILGAGDWTNYGWEDSARGKVEYSTLLNGWNTLEAGGIKVVATRGNHDFLYSGSTDWPNYFSSFMTGKSQLLDVDTSGQQWARMVYQLTIGNRDVLVITGDAMGGMSSTEFTNGYNWSASIKNTWLSTHPQGFVWALTHVWWDQNGNSNGDGRFRNLLLNDPNISFLVAGHMPMLTPYFGYRKDGNVNQVELDYEPMSGGHNLSFGVLTISYQENLNADLYTLRGFSMPDNNWLDSTQEISFLVSH